MSAQDMGSNTESPTPSGGGTRGHASRRFPPVGVRTMSQVSPSENCIIGQFQCMTIMVYLHTLQCYSLLRSEIRSTHLQTLWSLVHKLPVFISWLPSVGREAVLHQGRTRLAGRVPCTHHSAPTLTVTLRKPWETSPSFPGCQLFFVFHSFFFNLLFFKVN